MQVISAQNSHLRACIITSGMQILFSLQHRWKSKFRNLHQTFYFYIKLKWGIANCFDIFFYVLWYNSFWICTWVNTSTTLWQIFKIIIDYVKYREQFNTDTGSFMLINLILVEALAICSILFIITMYLFFTKYPLWSYIFFSFECLVKLSLQLISLQNGHGVF